MPPTTLRDRCFPSAIPARSRRRSAYPRANLIDKPPELSFAEAACLADGMADGVPHALQAVGARPGDTVLIQGAGGGVATALIVLARQAGMRVWVTSRDETRGARAVSLGAHRAFPAGARPPGARGRGDGERWCRDVVTLDQRAEARWHARDLRRDLGRQSVQSGADQDLLQAASGDRLDHGHSAMS